MSARVERHETFEVDGVTLHALVRGAANAPVVLLLQAGPGLPMIHEADALEARLRLEADHRVVYLDPRGTGLSLAPDAPLSIDRLVADVVAVVAAVASRMNVTAVDVVGFSLGGTLALLAAQHDPRGVRSVVAVGPDIDITAAEAYAWRFVEEQALRRGLRAVLARARSARDDASRAPSDRFLTRVRLATNLGGIAIGHSFAGMLARTLVRLFTSRWYSLGAAVRALAAMRSTQEKMLAAPSFVGLDIRALRRLDVPITILQGRLDAAAPPDLAARFYDALDAPAKELVWFDECAHMPHFEAPAQFRSALANALALGARRA